MEKKETSPALTLALIKSELEKFLQEHQHQNQQTKKLKSSCEENSPCDETNLAQKLMRILANKEEARTKDSPMEKAMTNSVVLRKILNYMDLRSLLSFRLVSRLWREEATSLLLSERHQNRNEEFLSVKFRGFAQEDHFRHKTGKTLEDFLEESAQNSGMSVYSGFIFEGGNFELDPSLGRLFSDFGSRIQHLNLNLEYLDVDQIRKILLESIPNLKSLILNPQKNWVQGSYPLTPEDPRLFLPKLKKLALPNKESTFRSNSVDLICEILNCAPNLTSIEDPTLSYITQIISAGKVSLVKSLTWSFLFSTDQVTNLVNFVAAGPKLTSLTLRDFSDPYVDLYHLDPRIFPALLSLINLGQNTLEKVTGLEILGLHFRLHGPNDPLFHPLPNLTELHLIAEKTIVEPTQKILPRDHDLSRIAPNLKILHLKTDKLEIYPFTCSSNAHNSLQKLEIFISAFKMTSKNVRQWVETTGSHYPNITHLDVSIQYKGEENIPECLKLIPKYFKRLEQLVLRFCVAKNSYDQLKSQWNLDEALTGFSKEECNTLKKNDEPNIEVLGHVRTAPSILDLEKLTNLTFEVQFKGKVQPLWSHVSELYVFQPMEKRQGLQVNVCGHYNNCVPLTGNDLRPL